MSRALRLLLAWVPLSYAGWIAMEAIHEGGHFLAALASGGRVTRVEVPPLGFSRTDVSPNPHPNVTAWGGPFIGSVLPVAAWGACRQTCRRILRLCRAIQFFAGFCLISNGLYIGIGWIDYTGDAGDLRRHGTAPAMMVAFGFVAFSVGMLFWHRLGATAGATSPERRRPSNG